MHASRALRSHLVTAALLLLATSTACDSLTASLCRTPKRTAAVRILSAWCERYTECDPKRGTVEACVSDRIGIAAVPDETGCAASCSEDTSSCQRSTCTDDRITKCTSDSRAMACTAQVNGPLIQLPDFCDSCYK